MPLTSERGRIVRLELLEEDASRHKEYLSPVDQHQACCTDVIAHHQPADRLAQLLCNTRRHGHCRHAPRLHTEHAALEVTPEHLRDLGALAAASGSDDNGHAVPAVQRYSDDLIKYVTCGRAEDTAPKSTEEQLTSLALDSR